MQYDVVILGLGGMGSSALYHLAQRGKRVLGLEQFEPAHSLGSSHGQSRIIRQAYFEDPAYVPLLLRAYENWAAVERQSGKQLLQKTGGLLVGQDSSAVIRGATRSAQEWGLAHELLAAKEIRRHFPAFAPRPDEVGLFEPEAGALDPEASILTHLELATKAGAEVRFGHPVLEWRVLTGGGVLVRTAEGEFTAERLVITAGAWLAKLAPELGLPLQVERNVMHWFEPLAPASDLPVFIVERPGVPLFYGFPDLGGHGPKAALHHSHLLTTPGEIDRTVAPGEGEALRRIVADWMPGVIGPIRRSAACMYTNTPDEHFVIGRHPEHEQVVIAGGFSGHGFKFVSVVGEILADLATKGSTALPIGLFDPTRFGRVK